MCGILREEAWQKEVVRIFIGGRMSVLCHVVLHCINIPQNVSSRLEAFQRIRWRPHSEDLILSHPLVIRFE